MFGRTLVFDPRDDEPAVARDVDTVGSAGIQTIEAVVAGPAGAGGGGGRDHHDGLDDDDDWFPAEIAGDGVTKASLCCRMFITEYVHIHQMDSLRKARKLARSKSKSQAQGALREPKHPCTLTRGCAPLLMIAKFLCVGMWVAGIYYGITSIEDLFGEVSTVLDPPEDSRSFQAFANYDTLYQTRDYLKSRFSLYVTVTAPSEDLVYSDAMRQFSRVLQAKMECPWGESPVAGTVLSCMPGSGMTLNVGSYFRLQADWETSVTRQDLFSALNATSGAAEPPKTDLLRQAQEFYTSEDGLAQLIDVGLTRRRDWSREHLSDMLDEVYDFSELYGTNATTQSLPDVSLSESEWGALPWAWKASTEEEFDANAMSFHSQGFKVRATQITEMLDRADDTVVSDLELTDAVTLPIAFILVMTVVGWSGVLALAVLASTVAVTLRLALPVALAFDMPSFGPSMFISFSIALSIDYIMFLLSAYRKATHSGMSNVGAVCHMLKTSGSAILVSGLILGVAVAALSFVTTDLVKTIGISGSVGVGVALVCNLTLVPSLLLIFGEYVAKSKPSRSDSPPVHSEGCSSPADRMGCQPFWRQVARMVLFHKLKVIAVLFLASAPFIWAVCNMHFGLNGQNLYVRDDKANSAELEMRSMGQQPGHADATRVIMLPVFPNASDNNYTTTEPPSLTTTTLSPEDCMDQDAFVASMAATFGIEGVTGCVDALVELGSDCATWSYQGTDLSLLAPTYCPVTCGVCGRIGTNVWRSEKFFNATLKFAQALTDEPQFNLGNNRSLQSISFPFGQPVEVTQANEYIDDAEAALEHIEYVGCYSSTLPLKAEFSLFISDADMNPSQCAEMCAAESQGRDLTYYLLGYKEYRYSYEYMTTGCHCLSESAYTELMLPAVNPYICDINQCPVSTAGSSCGELVIEGSSNGCSCGGGAYVPRTFAVYRSKYVPRQDSQLYYNLFADFTGQNAASTLMVVSPNWMSEDQTSYYFVQAVRDLMTASFEDVLDVYVVSDMSLMKDVVDMLFDDVPRLLLGGVCGAVLLLASVAFRSLLIGLRLLLTVAITMVIVFGAAGFTYGLDGGIYWLIIIIAAPIMIGLTMDYDMFLITKIFELRQKGYSTRFAILSGSFQSGSIITTAGLVMVIAFCALLLSEIQALQQLGFMLVVVSLVDTFIIRAWLVPSLMLVAVDQNWWPGKFKKNGVRPPAEYQWLTDMITEKARLDKQRGRVTIPTPTTRRPVTGVQEVEMQEQQESPIRRVIVDDGSSVVSVQVGSGHSATGAVPASTTFVSI